MFALYGLAMVFTAGRPGGPDNTRRDRTCAIEDQPNIEIIGGDIWFVRDMNNDGVAESPDHFMSTQVDGFETTGMIFHPKDPSRFVPTVMHPESTDLAAVANGLGDLVREYDVSKIVPPTCEGQRSQWMMLDSRTRQWVRACTVASDFNCVNQRDRTAPLSPSNP